MAEGSIVTPLDFEGKNIERAELMKIALKCANCGHRDLLKNFLKLTEWKKFEPIKPKDWGDNWKPKKWKPYYKIKMTKADKNLRIMAISLRDYEDSFYCPKCGSSLVVLDEKFTKNNIIRLL